MPRHDPVRITRRALTGGALTLGLVAPRSTVAQATPAATPQSTGGYAQPDWLVDTAWLAARLDVAASMPGQPLLPIGLLSGEAFAQGFIPWSVGIDWPDLELGDSSPAPLADWQAEVERKLTNLGLTREHTVVTWDDGSLFAARLFWVLTYLGHADVRMLNGGLPAWRAAGYEVEVDAPEPPTPAKTPYAGVPQPDLLATLDEAAASLGNEGISFVDARNGDEYAAGHIPGAINVNYPINAAPDPPHFWRPADELLELYLSAGVSQYTRVIPYCSTGVRSAVTWFSLRLIGYADVRLFSGSWAEWSSHPDLPVVVGSEP